MIYLLEDPSRRTIALKWLAAKLATTPEAMVDIYPFDIHVAVRSGEIVGACLWTNWRGRSVEAHWAGEPNWLSREHLRDLLKHPFERLGCLRVTGLIPKKNRTARRVAEKIGFRLEGTIRKGGDNGTDLMLYGLLRSECRWIGAPPKHKGLNGHGQRASADL